MLFLAALPLFSALSLSSVSDKIKHVIVLMMENRSFDHMLGFLKEKNAEINGCLPNAEGCSNHLDPLNPASPSVTVDNTAVYVQNDPHHSISWTTEQIYGYPKGTTPPPDAPPTMDGFIAAYADEFDGDLEQAASIMKCFNPEHVPIITTLAMEFGFFDGWFAAVPGPTMVNRAYAGSATSHGMGTNDKKTIAKGLPQKTMFKQLLDMGLDYRVYYQDVPSVLTFKDMRRKEAREKYRKLEDLFGDLASGNMPQFTWVEPAYFTGPKQPATDQHPDHDVSLGEDLMRQIYEGLRASPIWEESLFLITYDEHGGFFDHVAPPTNVPNPDGLNSTDDPFDFTRLGIRVPAVAVSPWIAKGSVFHAPAEVTSEEDDYSPSQYEHSSIVATVVHKIFSPAEGYPAPEYLTKRDAWAKTFEWVFDNVTEARTDCPMTLPEVFSHQKHFPDTLPHLDGTLPLSDLQQELVLMLAGTVGDELCEGEIRKWSELEGFAYVERTLEKFFNGI